MKVKSRSQGEATAFPAFGFLDPVSALTTKDPSPIAAGGCSSRLRRGGSGREESDLVPAWGLHVREAETKGGCVQPDIGAAHVPDPGAP